MSTRKKVAISADAFDEVAKKLGQGQLLHVFPSGTRDGATQMDMIDIVLVREPAGEDADLADGATLDDVDFASGAARTRADELDMVAANFKRRHKSSDRGYTVDDVEAIHEKTHVPAEPAGA